MNKQLLVVAGPDKGRTFPLVPGQMLLVGRSKGTETRLTDPHVSRVHCHVEIEGDDVVITDEGSAGGTFVNGQKVQRQVLQLNDVIKIGDTQLRLQLEGAGESPTMPPPPAKPAAVVTRVAELTGQTLSRFEVGPVVAKGQTGVVFRARDTKEDRDVALKVFGPEFTKNDEDVQRFIRAMKTMLPIRHPNLVTLHGAGKTGAFCWVAMEYIEGESLTQVIQRIGTAGMLDWRNALRVAIHVARALDFAHQQSIIHRNLTPQNIMVRAEDKVTKLGDLMLAKAMEGNLAQQITKPGELIGDVRYMSPERTRPTGEVDGRSDIYSLGAVVYALLTGRPPFEGESLVEVITKIRQAEPAKPKKYQLAIPDLFEGTVMRMLAKRPEDRFQTAGNLLADLERVAKFQGVSV